MPLNITRRDFIKTSAIVGAGLAGGLQLSNAFALAPAGLDLYALSDQLIRQWGSTLLSMQITGVTNEDNYGGIWCEADKTVHGRVGDTIYPFFYLANQTKDHRYLDAATLLYRWIERRVSQPDGSWLNEPVKGSWKGTTVFMSIALAETLRYHSALMEPKFKTELSARLKKAGDFIYDTFNINFGNINYPITASYGLTLLGEVLDEPKFKTKGRELAHQAMAFITPKDGFLKGEGDPYYEASPKGCFSVDLGYNVEESLPSLAQYGLMTKDEEVLQQVTRSLQTHMELMLPDGAWDNSWGTRNYKWTYWGSRTSDGCQPAYALLAHRDPRFYKAALLNTQLMQRSTVNGLLQGGPHFAAHNVPVCVHHTFTHIKALVAVLEHGIPKEKIKSETVNIPREKPYGVKNFTDIQTWLIAKGDYRATVTGYDRDYKHTPNGHANGGALTMLWHKKTGPLLCASMNEYQMVEAGNQQVETDPHSMPLTPRIELRVDGNLYMNVSHHDAVITSENNGDKVIIKTKSKLVDKDQKEPATGTINCEVNYEFTALKTSIRFKHDSKDTNVKIIIPIIAKASEKASMPNNKTLQVNREGGLVKVSSNQPLVQMPTANGRIFNFVPGLEAIPLMVEANEATVELMVG